jgi:effector-binding domain-containing protein
MTKPFKALAHSLLALTLAPCTALAQATPAVPPPATVETAPLPPPAGAVPSTPALPSLPPASTPAVPPAAQAPSSSPGTGDLASPPAPTASTRPTLISNPGDPVDVDEVTIPSRPTAVLSGTSTWDDGFANLVKAFEQIEGELQKAGIAPAGRPVTVFVQTDDLGFRYEAMVPIERVPDGRAALGRDVRFGAIPGGKALRFVHKGSYEDIDSTYETITAYLDAKGVAVKDTFIEEYATDLTDPGDMSLEINVFAVPK